MNSSKTYAQFFSFWTQKHQLRFQIPPLGNQQELDKIYSSFFYFPCSIDKY